MFSLVMTLTPAFCRASAYTSASTSFSGKLAEPTTTVPDAPPPLSGLEPELDGEVGVAPVTVDDEPAELPLEPAVTAARPMNARAATPLVAVILIVIWVSFRTGWFIRSWPARAGRPGSPAGKDQRRGQGRGWPG